MDINEALADYQRRQHALNQAQQRAYLQEQQRIQAETDAHMLRMGTVKMPNALPADQVVRALRGGDIKHYEGADNGQ